MINDVKIGDMVTLGPFQVQDTYLGRAFLKDSEDRPFWFHFRDIAELLPRPFQRGDTVKAHGSLQTWSIEHIADDHAWLRNEECPEGWGVPLHQVIFIRAADQ